MRRARILRLLVVYANEEATRSLSYQQGWPRAFASHPGVRATMLNLAARGYSAELRARWISTWLRFDAVVLLHSVYSNACYLTGRAFERIVGIAAPKALFLGNEHKLLPEKIAFARALRVALLVTMLHHPRAVAGYRERVGADVMALPSAGLDLEAFVSPPADAARSIDIGYRAYDAPAYLGHRERAEIAEIVGSAAKRRGLVCDISLDPAARLDTEGWAGFLRRCRAQLGTEAGGDYLDFDDGLRNAVNDFENANPGAAFADIRQRFFADALADGAGRALSGRIPEAAAAGCAQILLEGSYAGYFEAGRDYIALRHDYANVEDCLDQLADSGRCARMVVSAREVAVERLAYPRLVDRFLERLERAL